MPAVSAIVEQRLQNQHVTKPARRRPADLVAWLGAVQAQEYPAAKWGLGLRMASASTEETIERACDAGHVLRTHVMRPTWHFVPAVDIRWMLDLTAPRVRRALSHYFRQHELDAALLTRVAALFERAVGEGAHLTREELGLYLERAGIAAKGTRLALATIYAELEGVICSGRRRGTRLTYALLAERTPGARTLSRDEALAELVTRYFRSHGPATVRDFVWWSGLTVADARRGLEMTRARKNLVDGLTYWHFGPGSGARGGRGAAYLLPIYDEYLVAYRDRAVVPHGPSTITSPSRRRVTFQHAVVIGGQVAGTWRTMRQTGALGVDVVPLRKLAGAERDALAEAAAAYAKFLRMPVTLTIA